MAKPEWSQKNNKQRRMNRKIAAAMVLLGLILGMVYSLSGLYSDMWFVLDQKEAVDLLAMEGSGGKGQPGSRDAKLNGVPAQNFLAKQNASASAVPETQSNDVQKPKPAQTAVAIANDQRPDLKGKRLAVVVAGSFLRFSLSSFLQNVAASVVEQGHMLDYYVSLTLENAPAYRADNGYMNYLTWDPLFDDEDAQDAKKAPTASQIKSKMESAFAKIPNATLRHVEIHSTVNIDVIPELIQRRNTARTAFPQDGDDDLRFPILDLRSSARTRTANANRNMLRLFWNQKHTWEQLVAYEQSSNHEYDYVMIMRDDTEWLDRFDFNLLLGLGENKDKNDQPVHVYVPSCDARSPPMHPLEINDHIAIANREAAPFFGDYFSVLFRPNLTESCSDRVPHDIRLDRKTKVQSRGCNSEMILKYALQQDKLRVLQVGQGYIPMQRAARVKTKQGTQTCFHKYCQSKDQPLDDHGLLKCKLVSDFV